MSLKDTPAKEKYEPIKMICKQRCCECLRRVVRGLVSKRRFSGVEFR